VPTWEGGRAIATVALLIEHEEGHLFPTFRLARQLAARGHDIVYLTLADGVEILRAQGFAARTILSEVFPPGSMRTLRTGSGAGSPTGEPGDGLAPGNGAAAGAGGVPVDSAAAGAGGVPGNGGAAGAGGIPGGAAAAGGGPGFAFGRPGPESPYARSWRGLLDGGAALDATMGEVRPDLLILTSFYLPHALVMRARYRMPVMLLTPLLRSEPKTAYATAVGRLLMHAGEARRRFAALMAGGRAALPAADLAQRILAQVLRMRELILCPVDLELPELRRDGEPEVHYVEPMVDLARSTDRPLDAGALDPARRLLYVSMGSQGHMLSRETMTQLLRAVAAAFAARPEWQVVIATGGWIDPAAVPPPPGGLTVAWAPQLQLLGRAAVAVTHGGLGSVKECICSGVPMVVLPAVNDQPANARRIAHHRLGVAGEIAQASPASIAALVAAADEPAVRQSVTQMQQRFLAADRAAPAVHLVEELLAAAAAPGASGPGAR
jgi:MGT family glycosyltransferase